MRRPAFDSYEKWNSYSRIMAGRARSHRSAASCGARRQRCRKISVTQQIDLNIDGMASSAMYHYDGTQDSIYFLHYDLVNLAYQSAGHLQGRDHRRRRRSRHPIRALRMACRDITGVELNPIFIDLHTRDPYLQKLFQPDRLSPT